MEKENKKRLSDFELSNFDSTEKIIGENEGLQILVSPKGWGARHTVATMAFLGSIVSYSMRINLSMAIVAMVTSNSTSSEDANTCPISDSKKNSTVEVGEFNWSSEDKGIILGAFFWGYVVTQVPAGMFSEKYGAKWVFGFGLFITAIFQLLTPLAARWGKGALIVSRIIQGFGEGVTPPATHVLLAQWAPPFERSKMGSFVYAGNQGGTVCAMLLSGTIINAGFLGGWPGVFYVFGTIGLVWFVFWCFLVYSRPIDHPRISKEELFYIEGSKGGQTSEKNVPTPWKEIFKSPPVWAIIVAQLGNGWGLYTLLTYMPTYMSSVLHFDIKENSLLSALPYFAMLVTALIVSWIADVLRTRKVLSTTVTRKVFNSLGHWAPAAALVGAAYTGCDKVMTVLLLTVAVAFSGCVGAAYQINHVDIAANHAGVLMGLCNGIANLAGIAAPYVAGSFTKDESNLDGWRLVFFLAAGIYFVDNLVYIIFGSGLEQPWNRPKDEATESDASRKQSKSVEDDK